MDESTVDTRLKRATGRIRELEARLAAYEEGAAAARRRPRRAVSASSRPSSRPRYEAAAPATAEPAAPAPPSKTRAAPAPARRAEAPAPPDAAAPEKPLPPAIRPNRAAQRAFGGPPPCGRHHRRRRRRRRGPPRRRASQPPPPPDVFPTRRPKGELRASAEDVADVISGAYDDAGTDDDEDVSFASVGVVRALRLPDASVGSVGPETTGGALEAAAYASMPLTEVNENFPKAGEARRSNMRRDPRAAVRRRRRPGLGRRGSSRSTWRRAASTVPARDASPPPAEF